MPFSQVRDAIDSLKNKGSRDAFGLSVKMLEQVKNILIVPLTKIINSCISEDPSPSYLSSRESLKCSSRTNFATTSSNKTFFSDCQFGFRRKVSTARALSELCESILRGFENGQFVGITFELEMAWTGTVLATSDRRQITSVNNLESGHRIMRHGVPRGSILRPLFLIICINGFSSALSDGKVILFADDTTATDVGEDNGPLCDAMDASRVQLGDWLLPNRLSLKVEKT
ncbi:hypothetical protein D910_03613, partial [Dendroctonus ponderosae]